MSDQIFHRLTAGGVYRKGKTDGGGHRHHPGKGVIEGLAELMAVRRLT